MNPRKDIRLCHIFCCSQKIFNDGLFPSFETLRSLVEANNIDIDPAFICRKIYNFIQDESNDVLQKSIPRLSISDKVDIFPEEFITRNAPSIHDELKQSLLSISINNSNQNEQSFLGISTPKIHNNTAFKISGTAEITDPDSAPKEGKSEIILLFSPEDLNKIVPLDDIFDAGPESVISSLSGLLKNKVTFHKEFFSSVSSSGICGDKIALSKLHETINTLATSGLEGISTAKDFRVSSAPNAAQKHRSSDSASGYRIHLSKSGAGWRLNLWKIRGDFECAVIQKKNETEYLPE